MAMRFFTTMLPGLFTWVPSKITSWPLWKPVVRASMAAWISLVLLVIVPVTRTIGNAAFFILIAAFLLPASHPFAIFIEQGVTTLVGLCLTWLWCLVIVAVAESVREPPSAARLARYLAPYADLSQAAALQHATFDGVFLSTKTSIVYAVFLGFTAVALAWVRVVYTPKLTIQAILCLIVLDIVATYGPLIPTFAQASVLPQTFILPAVVYVAVALVCTPIFGESVQHRYLVSIDAALAAVDDMMATQEKILQTQPSDPAFAKLSVTEPQRVAASAAYQTMLSLKPTLGREFSIGRVNGKGLRLAEDKIRRLQIRLAGVNSFHKIIKGWQERCKRWQAHLSDQDKSEKHEEEALQTARQSSHTHLHNLLHPHHKHHAPVALFENIKQMDLEAAVQHPADVEHVEQMCTAAFQPSQRLFEASRAGIAASRTFFKQLNSERFWFYLTRGKTAARPESGDRLARPPSKASSKAVDIRDALEELSAALREYRSIKRKEMLQPLREQYASLEGERPPTRGLFYVLLHQFEIIELALAVETLLEYCVELSEHKHVRLHAPNFSGLLDFVRLSKSQSAAVTDDEEPEYMEGQTLLSEEVEERDPDARRPKTILQWLLRLLARVWASATHGNLFYGVKVGIASVLAALPAYLDASASFYYHEKGLWVLIMSQLTMARFSGDTFLQLVYRLIATFIGALIGMVAWYISSGHGTGQPFGIAAIGAVIIPPLMFFRVHSPIPYLTASILLTVTALLVLGYSWIDGLGLSVGTQGQGFEVAWKRFVAVVIGTSISFIVSFFPKPDSARRRTRLVLARTMESLGEAHAELLSYATRPHKQPDRPLIRLLVSVTNKLRTTVSASIASSPFELKAGPWPEDLYKELQALQLEVSDTLSQLMVVFWRIDDRYREMLLLKTRFLDPQFIGDCSSVYWLMTQALRSSQALPQVTPSPLLTRIYSEVPYHVKLPASRPVSRTTSRLNVADPVRPRKIRFDSTEHSSERTSVDEERHGSRPASMHMDVEDLFSLDVIDEEGFMAFAAGSSLSFALIGRLDALMIVVKKLVGERMAMRFGEDVIHGRYTTHH